MDLSQKSETLAASDDHSWLGSAHGTESTDPVTLDATLFDLTTNFPDGFIPSGVVLGKVTASGLYGPYDDTETDGREVAAGHLFTLAEMDADSVKVTGAILDHGQVVEANLPTNHGLDAAAKADLTHIRYV